MSYKLVKMSLEPQKDNWVLVLLKYLANPEDFSQNVL